jgi:signal transduction histidine kinase
MIGAAASAARGSVDRDGAATAERWLASPALQLATGAPLFACIALLSATQLWLNWTGQGVPASFPRLLGAELTKSAVWTFALPLLIAVDARVGFMRRRVIVAVAAHAGPALSVFAIQNAVVIALQGWFDPAATGSFARAFAERALLRLPSALAMYGFLLGAVWLVRAYVTRERLRRGLIEAQLRNLRDQIQPHFLFNTLHTIGALIREGDRERAIATLVALSELLRRATAQSNANEVPLGEELAFARTYLSIQHARFGDRLCSEIDVDPGLEDRPVPFLLLQPLLENAIRHGLDLQHTGGRIRVEARVAGPDTLLIRVEDSGINGGRRSDANGHGMGLENIRGRLARLYADRQSLRLETRPDGGTTVTVRLPLRTPAGA